jgi:hypothetical protein
MWYAFCEHLRHCGRSGYVFVLVMLLTAIGALFGPTGMAALLGLLGAYLVWICVEISRQRDRFEKLGQQPPLASVDLKLARVKLANSKTQRLRNEQSQRLKTQRINRQTATSANTPLRLRPR